MVSVPAKSQGECYVLIGLALSSIPVVGKEDYYGLGLLWLDYMIMSTLDLEWIPQTESVWQVADGLSQCWAANYNINPNIKS